MIERIQSFSRSAPPVNLAGRLNLKLNFASRR